MKTKMKDLKFPLRQVHLDFHTSPWIGDTGAEFDAEAFARTVAAAHIDSITVFAKCHHGQCYYPTQTGVQHPALEGRDLLGEQLEALKRHGIRCPLYTTVVWEEDVAQRFPQWRQLRRNGTFAHNQEAADGKTLQPGFWKFNDFTNPEYQDYFEAHLLELLDRYECDGFFIDILFFHQEGTWSRSCRSIREDLNLWSEDRNAHYRVEWEAQRRFMERFNALIHGRQPGAHVFYNQQNTSFVDSSVGFGSMAKLQSQLEVESLPSGFWGYQHFPRLARQVFVGDKPWLGMTGRFQRMWGDFGGIKPVPALEYECFRAQAMGGGCSVGDQMPPRGRLDAAPYRLIGEVYQQIKDAEPFYEGSAAEPRVAVMHPGHPTVPTEESDLSLEGVLLMCQELHHDCVVLNDEAEDLSPYEAVILPDSVVVTGRLQPVLKAYVEQGGRLLISGRSGSTPDGVFALAGEGLEPTGDCFAYPTYWRGRTNFAPELSDTERVIYQAGTEFALGKDWETLVDRIPPYFRRSDYRFCSHFQTPPQKTETAGPAVARKQNLVLFADPVFREYRRFGSVFLRDTFGRLLEELAGPPVAGGGLPVSMEIYPRRKAGKLLLTLLHYIPVRKALEIDVIEERQAFGGQLLELREPAAAVVDWESGESLERVDEKRWRLPAATGRLLLEVTPA